ncbi:Uncharacterised protein [Mycobacteroides abscessus]|uniref:SWIM-type domain-containing protein n=4 Tax=Mycobacteroides abscessus TaxID=36809 RepID=A0ABD7HGI1_9MYCO|nr:hypothetical protein [Mycobacteroides abscessus]ESV59275.1 putative zinc finger SWIM domain protein [Mycobacteroides abscessus MAB_082312_2258]ESV64087.1 putative zinc finger SWIM domain protein [Mycobacteroides abscessus MAB_091912_2446]AIC71953.1 hypothetical protein MYCMA_07815 [Mycobacteroides abscessus subsp. massiliense str. GO 06]AMU26515.1 hypothetical protein A3N96_14690 [Mycobacteroides abscessus]AMU36196.1 hypothetical protein A3N98_13885 [Mycobacteroides abscessus]
MAEQPSRPDLDIITEAALIALTNKGLVKRAQRELDSQTPPQLSQATDGTVTARWHDGNVSALAADRTLTQADCTCGATTLCRHRIGLVLGYQRVARADQDTHAATPALDWSPAMFTDAELTAAFGAAAMKAAERRRAAGYPATVRRGQPPTVELPSSTVRFMAPEHLDFALTDADKQASAVTVVLAVWAFRLADAIDPGTTRVEIEVTSTAERDEKPTEEARDLAMELLCSGTVNVTDVLSGKLDRAAADLDRDNIRWLADTLQDLHTQLSAYRTRHAAFSDLRVAELLAEVHARSLASSSPRLSRAQILGTGEKASTRIRLTRLTALGARLTRMDDAVSATVYLVGDSIPMVIHRSWPVDDDPGFAGEVVGRRRIAGTTLERLASSSVVTESAVRHANRGLELTRSAMAKTSVLPLGRAWESLPDHLAHHEFSLLEREITSQPPRFVRPRIEAEFVRVFAVHRVVSMSYSPGDQRLVAEVADAHDGRALIADEYRSVAPGALDALHRALSMIREKAQPVLLSGIARRSHGRLIVEPLAALLGTEVSVFDFAPAITRALPEHHDVPPDPLHRSVLAAQSLLSQIAHTGLDHCRAGIQQQIHSCADELTNTGFHQTASTLRQFGNALSSADNIEAPHRWFAATIRVLAILEQL